jgi:hypothetical protein
VGTSLALAARSLLLCLLLVGLLDNGMSIANGVVVGTEQSITSVTKTGDDHTLRGQRFVDSADEDSDIRVLTRKAVNASW